MNVFRQAPASFKGLVICVIALVSGCADPSDEETTSETGAELKKNAIETWAFCGVNPHQKNPVAAAKNMANAAGINATMGPCMPPPSNYSPAFPGSRYVSPQDYLALAWINSIAGMQTIVYDARLWSDNPGERQAAYDFWMPHISWVRAWDMGDEFDPATPEWNILIHRWNIMVNETARVTGVGPFTNHLGSPAVLERALQDLPGIGAHLSFDLYSFPDATNLAAQFHSRVNHLMCAVNALPFAPGYIPTSKKIADQMKALRFSGCGSILVFGGAPVVGMPEVFGTSSLIDANGNATSWARGVRAGAQ